VANEVTVKEGGGIPEQEADVVKRAVALIRGFEQGTGKDFRERCERFFRQYRSFKEHQDAWVGSRDRDTRQGVLLSANEHWGANLYIPISFRTIEAIVPKVIANIPKILVNPRGEQWQESIEAVRLLLNRQQEQINIDLPFQAVMRSACMYGLGVGKTYWRRESTTRRRAVPRALRLGFKLGEPEEELIFDDPTFEDVDVFDFMWDPMGSNIETCGWVGHRVWMSTHSVLQRIESRTWDTESAQTLDLEQVEKMGSGNIYGKVWNERLRVSGFRSWDANKTEMGQPHEVLELHNGERVLTILDRQVLVQADENPSGRKPFQIHRPIPISKQFPGIGDLEPLQHLQDEMNTNHNQRIDLRTLAMSAGYAFDNQMLNKEDLSFGPFTAMSVDGNPNEAIMALRPPQVPGASFQEEQLIQGNIESVSGLQDPLEQGGNAQTATEAQLMVASLSRRIENRARGYEIEVVREVGREFLRLDQREILEEREKLRIPAEGMTEADASAVGAWQWFPIGPAQLQGEFDVDIEGGQMAARNIPQDRADAQFLWNEVAHDPFMDPMKPRIRALEKYGIENPQSWLRGQQPPIPRIMLRLLLQADVPPEVIAQTYIRAKELETPEGGESGSAPS
jgi:hypothetical protein